jgi:integrase
MAEEAPVPRRPRRPRGEGSIYRRGSDGVWAGSISLGRVNGRRKRITVYGKTEKEVRAKLREVRKRQEAGQNFTQRRRTVAEWLEEWLTTIKGTDGTRPQTLAWYRLMAVNHLVPRIGHIKLDQLGPAEVRLMLADMVKAGVGTVSVRRAHALLRNALNDACRMELVSRNVATLVKPPPIQARRARFLTEDEARRLLAVAAGRRLYPLLVVAVTTGLRRGELLALRWEDVDLDRRVLRVRQAVVLVRGRVRFDRPKSATSIRTVPMPQTTVGVLREHRVAQDAERERLGEAWTDLDLVFPSTIGTPMEPRNLSRWFNELRTEAGLPWLRLHDLRHACATFLLAQGVDLATIKDLLGHSQISVTADIYTHVLERVARGASDALDRSLFGQVTDEPDGHGAAGTLAGAGGGGLQQRLQRDETGGHCA